MANIKASIKDIRKSRRRRERNKKAVSGLREAYKKALKGLSSKSSDAVDLVKKAIKTIDKAVSNYIIKPNAGSRRKSRLMKVLNTLKAGK
jgi:small subunit ribosomal protein S20